MERGERYAYMFVTAFNYDIVVLRLNDDKVVAMAVRGEIKNPEMLGWMLQQGRLLKGISQQQLADQLGTSQRYIWDMERGKPSIVMKRLFEILRATNVKLYAEFDVEIPPPADTSGQS